MNKNEIKVLLDLDFCKMTVFHNLLAKLPLGKESKRCGERPRPDFP